MPVIENVPVIVGGADETSISVQVGQPYTDEVIAEITKAAQSTATRHGLVVTGWVNADGSAVTGATIAKAGDRLTAVWDSVNPLVPETLGEGAVDNSKAVTYDAYVLDASGNAYGTVTVTVGKESKGLSSVKAVVKPYTGGAGGVSDGGYGFTAGAGGTVSLAFNGKKFTSDAGVSAKYTASTGEFSGSYKASGADASGNAKKLKFRGVFVNGVGYGTDGTLNVTIAPAK